MQTSAYLNTDGKLSVLIINTEASTATVSVTTSGFARTTVNSWITDNKNDMEATATTISSAGVVSGSCLGSQWLVLRFRNSVNRDGFCFRDELI